MIVISPRCVVFTQTSETVNDAGHSDMSRYVFWSSWLRLTIFRSYCYMLLVAFVGQCESNDFSLLLFVFLHFATVVEIQR